MFSFENSQSSEFFSLRKVFYSWRLPALGSVVDREAFCMPLQICCRNANKSLPGLKTYQVGIES